MSVERSNGLSLKEASATATLRTVARVVAVLELVADGSALTVSQFASRLELPISSAHSLVRRLTDLGYLEPRPGERGYQAGPTLVRLGIRVSASRQVIAVAKPYIAELADETGEDVYLAIPDPDGIVYADRVEGRQSLRLSIKLGEPRPLHSTAVGKLYLAYLDNEARERVLSHLTMERHTGRTVTAPEKLRRQIQQIRREGVSITDQEHLDGVAAIAAPILDPGGRFLGSITIALPRSRFTVKARELTTRVVRVAETVSRQLGWAG